MLSSIVLTLPPPPVQRMLNVIADSVGDPFMGSYERFVRELSDVMEQVVAAIKFCV